MAGKALIALEDGAAYWGEALAGSGSVGGEIVFNTSMAGYQEIATDPSYAGQLITYTFPLNGNYGTHAERDESGRAHARAIIAREITNYRYNRSSTGTWLDWLSEHDVLAVGGVDTRALTRHIRDCGALRAVISTDDLDVGSLRARARKLPSMTGLDLASVVSCKEPYTAEAEAGDRESFRVVAFDFGIKRSIVRYLCRSGCHVTVVPASTSARDVLKLSPDGVFLSNGPGDPAAVSYAVKAVGKLLGSVPLFGICLGHQLLALALGMTTYKLKYGHRGANHPVKDLRTGVIEITTQNHGFAVRDDGARGDAEITHVNLNDGTVEGLASASRYAFSVQHHPESTPGPHDSLYLFDRFIDEMRRFRKDAGRRK